MLFAWSIPMRIYVPILWCSVHCRGCDNFHEPHICDKLQIRGADQYSPPCYNTARNTTVHKMTCLAASQPSQRSMAGLDQIHCNSSSNAWVNCRFIFQPNFLKFNTVTYFCYNCQFCIQMLCMELISIAAICAHNEVYHSSLKVGRTIHIPEGGILEL